MRRILFIGAVNLKNLPLGGEEYKNQLFVSKLEEDFFTVVIDTFNWSKRPRLLLRLFWNLFFVNFDRIVVSASSASTYKLIKALNFFPSKLKKTFYFVIGGYFPEGLQTKVYNSKYYKHLRGIVVEGELLKQGILETDSFNNISVIPNFKIFNRVEKNNNEHFKKNLIKFIFISRITKTKGVGVIFESVKKLNQQGFENIFSVDFYGKIDADFVKEFKTGMQLKNCSYKGYLDIMNKPSESYRLLANYHVMLFPTFWKGEGFPGVMIDAYVAGLPVIASDWNMNKDVVENGRTGELVPINDSQALAEAMQKVIKEKDLWATMAENSFKEARAFHLDTIWPQIKDLLNRE